MNKTSSLVKMKRGEEKAEHKRKPKTDKRKAWGKELSDDKSGRSDLACGYLR